MADRCSHIALTGHSVLDIDKATITTTKTKQTQNSLRTRAKTKMKLSFI